MTLVDEVAKKKGTTEVARAYLQHLFPRKASNCSKAFLSPLGQRNSERRTTEQVRPTHALTIDDVFGGWNKVQPSTLTTTASSTKSINRRSNSSINSHRPQRIVHGACGSWTFNSSSTASSQGLGSPWVTRCSISACWCCCRYRRCSGRHRR